MGVGVLFTAVQIQVAEVLLLDFGVGAVIVQGFDAFIEQCFQLFVAFGDADGSLGWQQFAVDWLADFIVGAGWRLQKASSACSMSWMEASRRPEVRSA